MRIRNARTFSFLGMGGRGNSPPQWDANFLLFYYLKNIFSIDFFMGYSLGGRVGDAFSNTPQMCGRGLLRSRFGGWAETQRWGGTWGIRWVVGWGMRFRTPPKCADAVYCVRALGGGRKRRGGEE